jgi:hypothetical protein
MRTFILLLSLFFVISCKTKNATNPKFIEKNTINLGAYEGDFNPNNIVAPNQEMIINSYKKCLLFLKGIPSVIEHPSVVLDTLTSEKLNYQLLQIEKEQRLIFNQAHIETLLIVN